MSRNSELYPYEFTMPNFRFEDRFDEYLWMNVSSMDTVFFADKLSNKFKKELDDTCGKDNWIHRSNNVHRIAFKENKHCAMIQLKYG